MNWMGALGDGDRGSRTGWGVKESGVVRFRWALAQRVPAEAGVPSRGPVYRA